MKLVICHNILRNVNFLVKCFILDKVKQETITQLLLYLTERVNYSNTNMENVIEILHFKHIYAFGKTKINDKFYNFEDKYEIHNHSWGTGSLKPSKTFSLGLKVSNIVCSFQNLIETFTFWGFGIEWEFLRLVIKSEK